MWELGLLEAPSLANHLLIRHCYLVDGGGGGGGGVGLNVWPGYIPCPSLSRAH